MPTPSDHEPPTPPLEASSSRASFASCPPEEEREAHPPREPRSRSQSQSQSQRAEASRHVPTQEPTPEPDTQPGASPREDEIKTEHIEDVGIVAESPCPPIDSPEPGVGGVSEGDGRVARQEEQEEGPRYLVYPSLSGREQPPPHTTTSFLRPGAKFHGTQQSDRQVYDVQVEIKDVDLVESQLCGYLRIQGLTDDHPTLTTFFEGEIIGPKYLFRTQHPSWNSSEKIDLQHWARFPAFRPLASAAKASSKTSSGSSSFTLKNYMDREHLFMRWKEYFLVPDHRVKSISGASFEGFYYICFDQRQGIVSGIYFHAKSEKYQQLELRHVHDGGCVGAVEFR